MTQSDSKRKSFGIKLRNKLSTLSEKISQAWKTIRQRVVKLAGETVEDIIFFFEPDSANPNESAEIHRRQTVDAIKSCLGEDPAGALLAMFPQDRELALTELHTEIAIALGIEPCLVSSEMMNGCAGLYSFSADTIAINALHIQKQPMSLIEAKELLGTICHETYHAFQHRAIVHPSRYGISKADAKIWKINFANYISPEQNPERYLYQPVEMSAYVFESAIIKRFYKED